MIRSLLDRRSWKQGLTGCWTYTWDEAQRYPRIKAGGVSYSVHVWSYEQTYGPVPVGLEVMHSCANTRCWQPRHLSAGTSSDNNFERCARLRGRSGNHRLTAAQVAEIRQLHAEGMSAYSIAKQYPVNHNAVWRIVTGKTWKV